MSKQKGIQVGAHRKGVPSKASEEVRKRFTKKPAYEAKVSKVANEKNVANEPDLMPQVSHINAIEFLYGKTDLKEPLFRNLLKLTKLHSKTLAENVFEITPKTFTSYLHEGKKLPRHMIEKAIKLEDLYLKGIELFSSVTEFNLWMKKESYGLGLRIPLDLIGTITGIDLIYNELIRIEFGATA